MNIEDIKRIKEIHGQNGNWNYDEYMLGLYNGLELALAIAEGREPTFREYPQEWFKDKNKPFGNDLEYYTTSN